MVLKVAVEETVKIGNMNEGKTEWDLIKIALFLKKCPDEWTNGELRQLDKLVKARDIVMYILVCLSPIAGLFVGALLKGHSTCN